MGDFKGGVYRVVPTIVDLGELRVMGAPVSVRRDGDYTPRRERAEKLHLPPIRA